MAYKKDSNMPIVHCAVEADRVYLSEVRWFDNVPCCDRAKYRSVEWIFKLNGTQVYTTGAVAYDAAIENVGEGSTYKQINLGEEGIRTFLAGEGVAVAESDTLTVCVKVKNGCDLVKEKECDMPAELTACCEGSGGGCSEQYVTQEDVVISDVIASTGPFTIAAPATGEIYLPSVKVYANGARQGHNATKFGYTVASNADGSVEVTTTESWGAAGDPCTIILEYQVKVTC